MKKTQRALTHDGIEIKISKKQEESQDAYLDSLPKAEQLRLISNATGIPVTKLLAEIASLNAAIQENEYDPWAGPVPYK